MLIKMEEHPIYKGYFGTEDGKVFSNKGSNKSFRQLKPVLQKTGYYIVHLRVNKKHKQILHHRFISEIFLPNPNQYPEINHKDEDKSNNSISNLEWCTHQYNLLHSSAKFAKFYTVENIKTGEKFEIFNLTKWCKDNKIDRSNAYQVINGKWKRTKNFKIFKSKL
jgi:DNA/RNA endonuclease G (NUC1)